MLDHCRPGSRNHEDAIYPTTKLSKITTYVGQPSRLPWQARGLPHDRSLLSRKQERNFHTASSLFVGCAKVSRPRHYFSVSGSSVPDTNDKNPNLVRASHPAGGDCIQSVKRSLLTSPRQFGRFRGKRLNIELGSQVVNSGQIYSSCLRKSPPNRPSTSRRFFDFSTILLRKLNISVLSRTGQGVSSKTASDRGGR